jgi:hypothetical protein
MASKLICDTQENTQSAYKLTLWRVRETVFPLEKQQCIVCVFDLKSLSTARKYRVLHNNAFTANSCRRQQ